MEDNADLHDWEIVHDSDLTDYHMGVVVLNEDTAKGAIKDDYFPFDSCSSQNIQSEEDSSEGGIDSDNPSGVDDSDSNTFLESSREHLGFVGMRFPMRNPESFLSDESSEGQRSLTNSVHAELESLEDSVMEMGSEVSVPGYGNSGGENEGSDSSDSREITENGGDTSINEGEKKEKIWWKVPLGLLKYCLVGMRPVWSVSMAAAVLGIVLLWKKLYRMNHKRRSIPLKFAIDVKASQFTDRSARLNEAFWVVRRMPIIRPSLQASGATQWAQWVALPLR
ncbi:uncharacterized protein LOC110038462 isoform X2 [Phalaenopsis equestris]|uniref:uncharacterized protein LOC110038462 isoform X2 n=1 Tax=Phalaenopsis equestris TaxID=78828 RepID=UPI0009E3EC4F|nr:uncharacterized protein LOC110038462 isoform X2 [Phalaenopsis equestris]